jgi:hypothetical protein
MKPNRRARKERNNTNRTDARKSCTLDFDLNDTQRLSSNTLDNYAAIEDGEIRRESDRERVEHLAYTRRWSRYDQRQLAAQQLAARQLAAQRRSGD